MFEKASRLKLRFMTSKGTLTMEDLWDLPLQHKKGGLSLDKVAKEAFKELKESEDFSFVVETSKTNELLQLRFDIIKHIIDTKLEEAKQAKEAAAIKKKKQKILEIIAEKESDVLKQSNLDELKAMLESL